MNGGAGGAIVDSITVVISLPFAGAVASRLSHSVSLARLQEKVLSRELTVESDFKKEKKKTRRKPAASFLPDCQWLVDPWVEKQDRGSAFERTISNLVCVFAVSEQAGWV